MLWFNAMLTLICIWIAMYLNNNFLRVARLNKVRFKLFALRDELAFLAMQGEVKEDGLEYETLMKMLNGAINIMDHFSVIDFLKFLVATYQDEQLQDNINAIFKKIDHHNEKYKVIVRNFFTTMGCMLDRHTRIIRMLLPILLICFYPFHVLKTNIDKKSKLIKDIIAEYKEKSEQASTFVRNC
jgi:hypothetical protein